MFLFFKLNKKKLIEKFYLLSKLSSFLKNLNIEFKVVNYSAKPLNKCFTLRNAIIG